jgi:Gas vesicle synthesis protein GvpL/GvpF
VIQLVAITDDQSAPAPPLRAVACDGLTAICAPADESPTDAESLWRHEELVESLMETRDLLPVRFGTLLPDDDAVAHAVRERGGQLAGQLERVRGAIEIAVRIRDRASSPLSGRGVTSGTDYMRLQAERVRSAQTIHDELSALARDSTTLPGPELMRAAYLVDRGDVDELVACVQRLQGANADLDLICTGPWPPYSFAEAERS